MPTKPLTISHYAIFALDHPRRTTQEKCYQSRTVIHNRFSTWQITFASLSAQLANGPAEISRSHLLERFSDGITGRYHQSLLRTVTAAGSHETRSIALDHRITQMLKYKNLNCSGAESPHIVSRVWCADQRLTNKPFANLAYNEILAVYRMVRCAAVIKLWTTAKP
jgi:hypothetical protein